VAAKVQAVASAASVILARRLITLSIPIVGLGAMLGAALTLIAYGFAQAYG
jgi:hypothetical protein